MLTHIHPSRLRLPCRTRPRFNGPASPARSPGLSQGPPGAQSPFARTRSYLERRGVLHPVRGHYPSFIALTNSCARPKPSCRLRLSTPTSLCRLLSVPAGSWPFPTLSLRVCWYMPGPIPRWVAPVRMPVSSRNTIGLLPVWTRSAFPPLPIQRLPYGKRLSRLQSFDHLQACTFACHSRRSYPYGSKSVG